MSCVREASPSTESDLSRSEIKKKRFHPLRGLRRIFRRKDRSVAAVSDGNVDAVATSEEEYGFRKSLADRNDNNACLESGRCHSTSRLADDPDTDQHRRSFHSAGLSVSHDSVFSPEQRSPDSGSESPLYNRLGFPHSSSIRAELFEVVRRRRVCENNASDDEDLGLPRSPISNSPTTAEDMFSKANIVTKSSQSTCSDGSLLSMESSEIEEDSFTGRNSSKLSLYEKKISFTQEYSQDCEKIVTVSSSKSGEATGLCHNAAKHKLAVKPKRTHGIPNRKRPLTAGISLPSTPEVNEELNKHLVSEETNSSIVTVAAEMKSSDNHQNKNAVLKMHSECFTEITTRINYRQDYSIIQSKTASLPVGASLTPPSKVRLSRSKSNVMPTVQQGSNNDDACDDNSDKKEENFFTRLLSRRSGKKKKNQEDLSPLPVQKNAKLADSCDGTEEIILKSEDNIPSRENNMQKTFAKSADFDEPAKEEIKIISQVNNNSIRNESEKSVNSYDCVEKTIIKTSQKYGKSVHKEIKNLSEENLTKQVEKCSDSIILQSDGLNFENDIESELQETSSVVKRNENINRLSKISPGKERAFNLQPTKFLINTTTKMFSENDNEIQKNSPITLKKSSSFCKEKLPFSMDMPSLPVNIGLRDDDDNTTLEFEEFSLDDNVFEKIENKFIHKNYTNNHDLNLKSENIYGKISNVKNRVENKQFSNFDDRKIQANNQLDGKQHLDSVVGGKLHIKVNDYNSSNKNESQSENNVKIRLNSTDSKFSNELNQIKMEHHTKESNDSNIVVTSTYRNSLKGLTSVISINSGDPVCPEIGPVKKHEIIDSQSPTKNKSYSWSSGNKFQRSISQENPKFENFENQKSDSQFTISNYDTGNSKNINSEQHSPAKEDNKPDCWNSTKHFQKSVSQEKIKSEHFENRKLYSPHLKTSENQQSTVAVKHHDDKNSNSAENQNQSDVENRRKSNTEHSVKFIQNESSVNQLDVENRRKSNTENSVKFIQNESSAVKRLEQQNSDESIQSPNRLSKSASYDHCASNVIMRKKSKDASSRDDEPELMKVFARRSLKLKEVDVELEFPEEEISVPVIVKSRDSDKENELDSPPEERKNKEEITSSSSAIIVGVTENTISQIPKYQRSISIDNDQLCSSISKNQNCDFSLKNQNNDKRQRSKTTPIIDSDIKQNFGITPKPATSKMVTSAPKLTELSTTKENKDKEVLSNTPYKRIQQRRDEWEKRAKAQLATKVFAEKDCIKQLQTLQN